MRRTVAIGLAIFSAVFSLVLLFNLKPVSATPDVTAPEQEVAPSVAPASARVSSPVAAAAPALTTDRESGIDAGRNGARQVQYSAPAASREEAEPEDVYGPAWHRERSTTPSEPAVENQRGSFPPFRVTSDRGMATDIRQPVVLPPVMVGEPAGAPPLAPTAAFSTTLIGLHRNVEAPDGLSSSLVFTNTGAAVSDYYLHFGWPNDDYVGSDGPISLAPGSALVYDLASWPLGETVFYGNVTIAGDQPLEAVVTTPDYPVLQGVVVEEDGATPAQVHSVNAHRPDDDWNWYGGTYNLGDGTFHLGGLPAAQYALWIHAPYPWASQWYNGHFNGDDADLLDLSAGTVSITVTLQPGGYISGTVYADDGVTPLPNINVDIEQGGAGTCTDANGRFVMDGLPYGTYKVRAGGDWNWCLGQPSLYVAEYYQETSDPEQATELTLDSGSDIVTGIDFTLQSGGMITGRVFDAGTGVPLADVQVNANEYLDGQYGSGAQTSASGVYTITGLATGEYRVAVDDTSSIPAGYAFEFFSDTHSYDDAQPVPVAAGSTVGSIDFALEAGGIITGTVVDELTGLPIPQMKVEFYPLGENWGWGTCTDENGYYEAPALPYRVYKVSAGGGWNWCQEQPGTYVQEFYDNTPFWQDAAELPLDGGSPAYANVDFTLETGGFIAGNVTQTGGAPVEGVRIEAQVRNGDCPWCYDTLSEAYTEPDGDYVLGPLPGVAVGVYACTDCTGHLLVGEYYDDVYDPNAQTMITVTGGITITGIDLELDPGVWITGHVAVPAGYTSEGIPVDAWKTDGIWFGTNRQTDAGGNYILPVPPIYDSYWGVSVRPYNTDLGFQWAHQFDLGLEASFDFDLTPGGTIAGCVVDGAGPVADIWINADAPQMNQQAMTGPDGCYEMTNLPAADYVVILDDWQSGYMMTYYGGHAHDWATTLPLEPPEVIGGIDLEIAGRGQIEGYVYESDGPTPIEGVRVVAMNEDGFWEGYSQPDGYYTIDVPMGEHRLLFEQGFFDVIYKYWPDSYTWAGATPVAVVPLPDVTTMPDVLLDRPAEVTGQVRDAGTGEPLGGIHVAVGNVDPAVDRVHYFWNGCTDETGHYHIDRALPGESEILAIGTCGNYDYGLVTDTLTVLSGGFHTVDISMTAGTMPPAPFTVHTPDTYDYTPQLLGHNLHLGSSEEIVPALFEPLAQFDDNGRWYSNLLVDVPTVANGGVAIDGDHVLVTYTLRTDLFWSDGTPLTADDIRFTWEWMSTIHPRHENNFARHGLLHKILDVVVVDPQTAVARYDFRVTPPDYLAAITYLLPEHVLAGQHPMDVRWNSDYAHYPVGNGPYMVVDWVPGSHLDLVANPNYVRRGQGLPAIDEVRFLFTDSQFWSLLSGNAQVSTHATDELPPNYATFDLNYFEQDEYVFFNLVPNLERLFFADAAVRQALYMALNRQQIDATHWPERSYATSWLPASHPLYSDTMTLYPFDLTAAATMLDAAGWVDSNGNGIRDRDGVEFQFELLLPQDNPTRLDIVAMFQADLATIGVDLIPVAVDWGELIHRATYGTADAFAIGWTLATRYEPAAYGTFHGSQVPTAYNSYQTYNFSRWQNPLNDDLVGAMQTELDQAALRDLVAQHLALFSEDQPHWVTGHSARVAAAVPTLLGVRPGGGIPLTWNIAEWELPANPYDLTVRKQLALDSPAAQPGSTITYELTVRNAGFFRVTDVLLADELPPEVVFVAAEPAPTSVSDDTLLWELGELSGNSLPQTVQVAVEIPVTVTHGTFLENHATIDGAEPDTHPGNNGYVHVVEVRDDVDLAVDKIGVGQTAVGETYSYFLDYANWGGAPASGATLTDTLPPEVSFVSASPAPDLVDGSTLAWELAPLAGNQWGGQIEITAEIIGAGIVTNTGFIDFPGADVEPANNSSTVVHFVDDILSPVILRPTQGTTDGTPTVSGLAPSESVVDLYDLQMGMTWVASTTATVDGTFSAELNLAEGTYILAARASKTGLVSQLSNTATIIVDFDVPLDTDTVHLEADGVDISSGSVRAEVRTLAHRTVDVSAMLRCAAMPTDVYLEVTENALFTYNIPPTALTDQGGDDWLAEFRVWLAEPRSSYEIWLEWDCDGVVQRELLIYILIDPDGYVYDQSLVDGGSPITDSLILNTVVTAYVRLNDTWQVWNAALYGQTNPQVTDGATDDGVLIAGYYSFLTPSGQYRIEARAPGYQPYQSPVLTVITTPVHLDIGLKPVVGGTGSTVAPANLGNSWKMVDRTEAWVGDTLTYDIWLDNSGGEPAGQLTLEDALPAFTELVTDSLSADAGTVGFDAEGIWWYGDVDAGQTVHITYQVLVTGSPGAPFVIDNPSTVGGPPVVLATLDGLGAETTILNQVGVLLLGDEPQSTDPGVGVVYDFTITNTGNARDTFLVWAESSAEWTIGWSSAITLDAGASTTLGVLVVPQEGTPAGTVDTTILTATSSLAPSVQAGVPYTTTANQVASVALSAGAAQDGAPGESVTYTHRITNTGNGTDTFALAVQSDLGWMVEVSSNPTLAQGESATITVVVQVPSGASDGEIDTTTLTVTSTYDGAVQAAVEDITTVASDDFPLYLPIVKRP